MLRLKLNHVSKRGPGNAPLSEIMLSYFADVYMIHSASVPQFVHVKQYTLLYVRYYIQQFLLRISQTYELQTVRQVQSCSPK